MIMHNRIKVKRKTSIHSQKWHENNQADIHALLLFNIFLTIRSAVEKGHAEKIHTKHSEKNRVFRTSITEKTLVCTLESGSCFHLHYLRIKIILIMHVVQFIFSSMFSSCPDNTNELLERFEFPK